MRAVHTIFASAALSALIPSAASAADTCPPLTRITSVDTVAGPGGYMLVPVTFGNAHRLMLFDTGGSLSSIMPAAARELNIPTYESRMRIADVSGKVSDRFAVIPAITIGAIEIKKARYMVMPTDFARGLQSGGLAGILAPAPNVDLDLDFAAGKLSFFSTNHCDGKVVYWPAVKVAVVPMRNAGTQQNPAYSTERIKIPVRLDEKGLEALVDTGSTNTVLNLRVAEDRFDVDLKAPDVQEIGSFGLGRNKSGTIYSKRFSSLSFEGVTITDPVVHLLPDKQSGALGDQLPTGSLIHPSDTGLPDMIIGMDVLSKLHVYVAYRERKLYITAAEVPGAIEANPVSRPSDPALSIAGSWKIGTRPAAPVCEFMQNGGDLIGTCTGPQVQGELTGTVAGLAIRWQWKRRANANGAIAVLNFSGTMTQDNSISGFVKLNGRTAPFNATKQ